MSIKFLMLWSAVTTLALYFVALILGVNSYLAVVPALVGGISVAIWLDNVYRDEEKTETATETATETVTAPIVPAAVIEAVNAHIVNESEASPFT